MECVTKEWENNNPDPDIATSDDSVQGNFLLGLFGLLGNNI